MNSKHRFDEMLVGDHLTFKNDLVILKRIVEGITKIESPGGEIILNVAVTVNGEKTIVNRTDFIKFKRYVPRPLEYDDNGSLLYLGLRPRRRY